jgi:phosphoribosyl 1,2-cyclic phosphodiesterase
VRIHLCGVRGSTPAPGAEFARYGGHTSCVALAQDGTAAATLVLDTGIGLRRVTTLLGGQPFSGTILLTHLHWDHAHGLPFFAAGDRNGSRVALLLPAQPDDTPAADVLARGMSPLHFPIGPHGLRGDWSFGSIEPGAFKAEGFTVEALEIPHKGGRTFGYWVSDGHSTVTYLPDHRPTALGPGPDGWGEYHQAALDLAAGAELLIHDAFLLAPELPVQAQLGHAAAEYAAELGHRAGRRQVMLAHHRPDRTDDQLDQVAKHFAARTPRVTVGAEGKSLDL